MSAQSAQTSINHLKGSLNGMEKSKLRLEQAKVAQPKKNEELRDKISGVSRKLVEWERAVEGLIKELEPEAASTESPKE
jgi:predicted  nucleic acid-binding Zn-ribbon protein